MDLGSLLQSCIQVYQTYKPKKCTPDLHVQKYLEENYEQVRDEGDAIFIEQVFYGLLRYKKMIKILLDDFYEKNLGRALLPDMPLYMVLAYLLFIRLEELTWPTFEKFVLSQNAFRMQVFFNYVFDVNELSNVKEAWGVLYDNNFIENQLIGTIQRHEREGKMMLKTLQKKADGMAAIEKQKLEKEKLPKVTVPEPFHFTSVRKVKSADSAKDESVTKIKATAEKMVY